MKIKRTDFDLESVSLKQVFFFKKLLGMLGGKSEIPEEMPEAAPEAVTQEAEADLQMLSDEVGIGGESAPIMAAAPAPAPAEPEPLPAVDAAPASIPTPEVSPESASMNEIEVTEAAAKIQETPEPVIVTAPEPESEEIPFPEVDITPADIGRAPTAGEIDAMTKSAEEEKASEAESPVFPVDTTPDIKNDSGSEGPADAVGQIDNDSDPDTAPPSSIA